VATRFYLASTQTADITPGYDAAWEDTSIALVRKLYNYRIGFALGTVSFGDNNATNRDVLFRQYISEPLAEQTISAQTLKFQIRGAHNSAGANMFTAIGVRASSRSGASITGTILSVTRDGTVFTGTLTNRQFTATTTSLAVNRGDRLIIEIGTGGTPGGSADHDSDLRFGDSSTTDLSEDDTSTTDNNPWVEFPNTIIFEPKILKFGIKP
jgi:hypothetical protein